MAVGAQEAQILLTLIVANPIDVVELQH